MTTITMLQGLLKEGLSFAILLDSKGCEIRTGDRTTPLVIKAGQEVVFSPTPLPDEKRDVILVNYAAFSEDVKKTKVILLDNGEMNFEPLSIDGQQVVARSLDDGSIGSRRHINLPGVDIQLPSITDKDWDDLQMAVDVQADFFALSFIRRGEEVKQVREFFEKQKSKVRIISKIETKLGVENISDLIAVSDGIMVARGDLGAEIPYEQVPAVQDRIVRLCRSAGKPVIVATQMLESMISHPMPTRAEVTDVAHAADSRCDATMLSGETAMGKYSVGAVVAMAKVLAETERHLPPVDLHSIACGIDEYESRGEAACSMAQSLQAKAIVALTRSGRTARSISKFRPAVPIVACTGDPIVQRQLQLDYGVESYLIPFDGETDELAELAVKCAVKEGFVQKGQRIILVSDAQTKTGAINTLQVRTIS